MKESGGRATPRMGSGLFWGLAFATPFMLALSFVGLLVFYLGLFFYMLFGLLVGALMYRKWSPRRPLPRGRLMLSVAIVTVYTWGGGLYLEGWRTPINVSIAAIGHTHQLPKDMDDKEAKAIFRSQAQSFLREHHPPGGTIGYLQWMMSAEPIAVSLGEGHERIEYKQRQSRIGFPIRVGLSLVLLAFAVGSQVMPLRKAEDGPINALGDEPEEATGGTPAMERETR